MPMPKKTKKRIIFWSVFLGMIVLGVVVMFVLANNHINNVNSQIADSIFYGNNGGASVDEFASAVEEAMSR